MPTTFSEWPLSFLISCMGVYVSVHSLQTWYDTNRVLVTVVSGAGLGDRQVPACLKDWRPCSICSSSGC